MKIKKLDISIVKANTLRYKETYLYVRTKNELLILKALS